MKWRIFSSAILTFGATAEIGFAQSVSERSDSLTAVRCSENIPGIRSRDVATWSTEDRSQAYGCELSGVDLIVRLWRWPSHTEAQWYALKFATRRINDGLLADSVRAIALDEAAPVETRKAALEVLLGFVVPKLAVSALSGSTAPSSDNPPIFQRIGDFPAVAGANAVPGNIGVTVRSLLASLSASGQPGELRDYAIALTTALAGYDYAKSRPSASSGAGITLTYVCGNRFRIRNTNSYYIPLTFDVYGVAGSGYEVAAAARAPSAAYRDVFFDAMQPGTVRLFAAGKLIQTKANGGKLC
jgi:hypothetical protein